MAAAAEVATCRLREMIAQREQFRICRRIGGQMQGLLRKVHI